MVTVKQIASLYLPLNEEIKSHMIIFNNVSVTFVTPVIDRPSRNVLKTPFLPVSVYVLPATHQQK